ncbi:MAG: transposase [Cyanobacteria bacterium P01_G01_bin.39]
MVSDRLGQAHRNTLIILQVDNGRPHTAKRLIVPDNIILLFQPPYSPELNPIERLWQALKKDLKWEIFSDLNELHLFLDRILKELTPEFIASVCGYPFILNALSVANIY